MKEEIIETILARPLAAWNENNSLMINGVTIQIHQGYMGGPPTYWVTADGIEFHSPKINDLWYNIQEHRSKQEAETEKLKIENIHNKICKGIWQKSQ